jgi:hypothetical protein
MDFSTAMTAPPTNIPTVARSGTAVANCTATNARRVNHRAAHPAVEYADGYRAWYRDDRLHREDGPAIERPDGAKGWYRNGKFHRDDGPAVERANGYKAWYKNGQRHRDDGPAIEYADGAVEWFQNGSPLTNSEVERREADLAKLHAEPRRSRGFNL